VLGGRPFSFVAKEVFAPRNYVALARMARVCERPLDFAQRYFFGGGEYPYACAVRTPLGFVRPTLYSHHDVWTVSEVFCREDYRAGADTQVVVDLGSNIGVSALYFLTRNSKCRCYLYEPDPRNVARLKQNLTGFADRFGVEEAAVGPSQGVVRFGREPTGRYGSVGAETDDVIYVRCVAIEEALEKILAHEDSVDILKIDTEGLEEATVAAVPPDLLDRVRTIYFESFEPARLHEDRYDISFANQTVTMRRKVPASPHLTRG
jgi:FkbM family methyltransferase